MKDYVNYVDTNIGTIGHLLTSTAPSVLMPHGMVSICPIFNPKIVDRYFADKIYAFPTGAGFLMPVLKEDSTFENDASSFDHDFETAKPHEYSILLDDTDITVSCTVTMHCSIYKIEMPKDGFLKFYVPENSVAKNTKIEIGTTSPSGSLIGFTEISDGELKSVKKCDIEIPRVKEKFVCITYAVKKGVTYIKTGKSYIDVNQAKYNLEKGIPDFDYDKVLYNCKDVWNDLLGRIDVTGGSEKNMRCFYTALYRVVSRMNCISEYGRYYSGFDNSVHDDEGHKFYVNDGMWDTFRGAHPLQRIIEPDVHRDIVSSYIRMFRQCGHLPDFPFVYGSAPLMFGNHTASLFADSLATGVEFDVEAAFEAAKFNSLEWTMLPWTNLPKTCLDEFYNENGYYPALEDGAKEPYDFVHDFEKRQSVAVTLEASYDDWCIAQMAKYLGKEDDYKLFMKRSANYKNVWNAAEGFMWPKDENGEWIKDFNPYNSGGLGGRYYFAENNSWTYSFSVMHDNEGLIELMGGKEKFGEKLDRLFAEPPYPNKYEFLGQFPDATGTVGNFCMGNEPSFHIPYLYNYCNQPKKTQKRIRELMKIWFTDTPLGICGDEDGGAMSAWFVFSAMGFYPVCPASGMLDFGSPIFDKCVIKSGENTFTIKSEGASGKAKYIKSVTINGKAVEDLKFDTKEILNGGEMIMEMSER